MMNRWKKPFAALGFVLMLEGVGIAGTMPVGQAMSQSDARSIGALIGGLLGGGHRNKTKAGTASVTADQSHAHRNPTADERAFIMFVQKNDIEGVRQCIAKGVDVNGVYPPSMYDTATGCTAMKIAVEKDYRDILQLLLENHADVNGFYQYDNIYVPYLAVALYDNRDPGLLKYLHDWGVDINGHFSGYGEITYDGNQNALVWLADCWWGGNGFFKSEGNLACAKYLIDNGIDLEFKDNGGNTAFLWAAKTKWYALMDLLAAHGANLYARNKNGKDALDIALDVNDSETYKHVQNLRTQAGR